MKTLTLKAPAKINLGLSILGKLPSGYHEVKTIYAQICLFDVLTNKQLKEEKILVLCDNDNIPVDQNNLVYQAADLIKKETKTKKGVEISIKKKIPVGSGLGGGSSDAAQTLIGLNKLWHLRLSLRELTVLAKKIGMDVGYQLHGGVKLETQGGEKTGEFASLRNLPKNAVIVLCFPNIVIKSAWAYQNIEYDKIGRNDLKGLVKAINNQDLSQIGQNLHSDFELWTFKKYPVINEIKRQMLKNGALGSLMSGKGSAVFGLFEDYKKAEVVEGLLEKNFKQTFLVEPL